MARQKVRKGYKVVRSSNGILESACSGYVDEVKYGQFWTQPNCRSGPLCVFSTLKAAMKFVSKRTEVKVYRCLFTKSEQTTVWWGPTPFIEQLLKDLPKKTVLADAVYLLERVK